MTRQGLHREPAHCSAACEFYPVAAAAATAATVTVTVTAAATAATAAVAAATVTVTVTAAATTAHDRLVSDADRVLLCHVGIRRG